MQSTLHNTHNITNKLQIMLRALTTVVWARRLAQPPLLLMMPRQSCLASRAIMLFAEPSAYRAYDCSSCSW